MTYYPEFEHPAADITRYVQAGTLFSLMLYNGRIVHFEPDDVEDFLAWLQQHEIYDVKNSK